MEGLKTMVAAQVQAEKKKPEVALMGVRFEGDKLDVLVLDAGPQAVIKLPFVQYQTAVQAASVERQKALEQLNKTS